MKLRTTMARLLSELDTIGPEVTEVELPDRRAWQSGREWSWDDESCTEDYPWVEELPSVIWRLLKGNERSGKQFEKNGIVVSRKCYTSRKAANQALSAAVIEWARLRREKRCTL